ncbi:hypothetical protein DPMN_169888 [Dreissena polymorpha]|uniref:Uncharacterized protein n=1 Tax=Dreissena polymorpha TaxID=45954 RepID=A0A9D4DWC2_DREPO|nr:hypothetical protein DPMN_169888 [Dreissena polymorpha]
MKVSLGRPVNVNNFLTTLEARAGEAIKKSSTESSNKAVIDTNEKAMDSRARSGSDRHHLSHNTRPFKCLLQSAGSVGSIFQLASCLAKGDGAFGVWLRALAAQVRSSACHPSF